MLRRTFIRLIHSGLYIQASKIIVLLLLAAIAILAWGYMKAKPFGKSGILAWLQTVVLMGPWLLFFGLSAVGV